MAWLYKIFHPGIFQGSLKKKNYFEGWYFKHVSAGTDEAFAVIPGISLSDDTHAFIQFNGGKTGISSYFRYDISEFSYIRNKLEFTIGNSRFTENGIRLDLSNGSHSVRGELSYSRIQKPPSNILMPGIMGWYSYIPTMECNHGVVSVNHELTGSISVNGQSLEFSGGKGYIEKDWGISFPESWFWVQCNNFPSRSASVMVSVGKIPWRGHYFIGFVAFFSLNGKTTIWATYNGAKITSLSKGDQNHREILIRKGKHEIRLDITSKGESSLKAPVSGMMSNIIKESLESELNIEVSRSGDILFSEHGVRAGFEETEGIYSYFQ